MEADNLRRNIENEDGFCGCLQIANNLTKELTEFASVELGSPKFYHLNELSKWIIENKENTPELARILREHFKQNESIRSLLNHPFIKNLCTVAVDAELSMFDVVRLRTVLADFDFTQSRPHQDVALWLEHPNVVNVWISLCDIDESKAPLQIVNSSNHSIRPHIENEYGQMEVEGYSPDQEPVESILMSYGDVLLFDPALVHYSAPNQTREIRWSVDFRYALRKGNETI